MAAVAPSASPSPLGQPFAGDRPSRVDASCGGWGPILPPVSILRQESIPRGKPSRGSRPLALPGKSGGGQAFRGPVYFDVQKHELPRACNLQPQGAATPVLADLAPPPETRDEGAAAWDELIEAVRTSGDNEDIAVRVARGLASTTKNRERQEASIRSFLEERGSEELLPHLLLFQQFGLEPRSVGTAIARSRKRLLKLDVASLREQLLWLQRMGVPHGRLSRVVASMDLPGLVELQQKAEAFSQMGIDFAQVVVAFPGAVNPPLTRLRNHLSTLIRVVGEDFAREAVAKCPRVLCATEETLAITISDLQSILGEKGLAEVVRERPEILRYASMKGQVVFEMLRTQAGLSKDDLVSFLLTSYVNYMPSLKTVQNALLALLPRLGVEGTRNFILLKIRPLHSKYHYAEVISGLSSMFSKAEILSVFSKNPFILRSRWGEIETYVAFLKQRCDVQTPEIIMRTAAWLPGPEAMQSRIRFLEDNGKVLVWRRADTGVSGIEENHITVDLVRKRQLFMKSFSDYVGP